MSYVPDEQETISRIAGNYYDKTGKFLNLEGISVYIPSEKMSVPLIRDKILNPALHGYSYSYSNKLNDTLEMLLDLVVSTRDKEKEKGITSTGSFSYNDIHLNWITPFEVSKEQQIIDKVSLEYFKKSKRHLDFSDISIYYTSPYNHTVLIPIPITQSGIINTTYNIPDEIREDLVEVLSKYLNSAIEHRDYGLKSGYIGWDKIYKDIKISWLRQDLEEDMY